LGLNRGLNLKAALETEIKTKSAKRKKEKTRAGLKIQDQKGTGKSRKKKKNDAWLSNNQVKGCELKKNHFFLSFF
jgi:hypothetical protein